MRHAKRKDNELRTIEFIRHYTKHAEGSVLVKFGDTHVLCNASIEETVPSFLKGKEQGTASISGAYVALFDAVQTLINNGKLDSSPILDSISAISVGVKDSSILLDLDYSEDSQCDTDMNIVMTGSGKFIEIQGTAEGVPFSRNEMDLLINAAEAGIKTIITKQIEALNHS